MKPKNILRLMTLLMLGVSIIPTTVEAGFFDRINAMAKKARSSFKKVAHGPFGQMAMQAGGAAIAAKGGPQAGAMFQGAAQSMHLADQSDDAADDSDQDAQQAADDGDDDTSAQHKVTSAMHRATAAGHRADFAKKRKAYNDAGGNFDDDYETHVASRIENKVNNQGDDGYDADNDDSDNGDSGDDSDAGDDE